MHYINQFSWLTALTQNNDTNANMEISLPHEHDLKFEAQERFSYHGYDNIKQRTSSVNCDCPKDEITNSRMRL